MFLKQSILNPPIVLDLDEVSLSVVHSLTINVT